MTQPQRERQRQRQRQPTSCEAPDNAGSGNGRVNDGDVVSQLGLENTIEVLRASDGDEAEAVGQLGEHANLVAAARQPGKE